MGTQATAWPNWVDLVVIILTLRASYSGFGRGILAEFFYLAGTISITALACNFHSTIAQYLSGWLPLRQEIVNVVIFVSLLVLGGALLRIVISRLAAHLRAEKLPSWIQQMGFLLGAVRGLWWASLILWVLIGIGPYFMQSVEQRSLTGRQLLKVGRPAIEQAAAWFPGFRKTGVLVPYITIAARP